MKNERRLVIAGTGSGEGKTTITIGLMAALRAKGLIVQGFKCGPDYIDPTYHTAVTGRVSRNLDSWMLNEETLIDILTHGSTGADLSILEGVMGFFDGKNPASNEGSTAHVSAMTKSPVLLVVNCAGMARSAAAIVKGFHSFSAEADVVGVIANKVGSERHYQLVKTAIEQECHIPVVGYLKNEKNIEIPERSLGLIPSVERGELNPFFDRLGELISETVDLDKVLKLSNTAPLPQKQTTTLFHKKRAEAVTIAVAKDAAFNSYYPENFEILESYGAKLVYFSPLANEPVPKNIDGFYIGGGLPEEFIPALANNSVSKNSIKSVLDLGIPTFAECGGLMYLTEAIQTTEDKRYEMVGVLPGEVTVHSQLKAIGYRAIRGQEGNFLISENEHAKGHEYHYVTYHPGREISPAYEVEGMGGLKKEGYVSTNIVAGLTQFHFASNPNVAKNMIQKCIERQQGGTYEHS